MLFRSDENLRRLLPRIRRRVVTYGLARGAEVSAGGIEVDADGSRYELRVRGGLAGTVRLKQPGRTAVLNSLAAAAVGLEFGLGTRAIRAGLEAFDGVERRLERRGAAAGVRVVDDYAHHPSEIRATLEAIREAFGARTVVIFQPHRYSRLEALHDDFCGAFGDADLVVVTEVHAAGETPIPGIDGARLAAGIEAAGHPGVRFIPQIEEVAAAIVPELAPGDVVVTLGAGTIAGLPDALLEALRAPAD